MSRAIDLHPPRPRRSTWRSIPWVTWNCETSGSGGAAIKRSNVARSQYT